MKEQDMVYGYIPLLDVDTYFEHQLPRDKIDYTAGEPKGLIWVLCNGLLSPVLVLDDAKRVYDHILEWSNQKPDEWFKLYRSKIRNGKENLFVVGLYPDNYKTTDKVSKIFDIDKIYKVMFKPIYIISTETDLHVQFIEQKSKTATVMLLDIKYVDNYENIDIDKISKHLHALCNIEIVTSTEDNNKWEYCKLYVVSVMTDE